MQDDIRLHIGPDAKVLLVNKKRVENLHAFTLKTNPLLTAWTCAGGGPVYGPTPDDIFSNESFPLRLLLGDGTNQHAVKVVLLSRPLGYIKSIEIDLHPDRKDLIRFVFAMPMHQDIVDTLVSYGVEVDMPGEPFA